MLERFKLLLGLGPPEAYSERYRPLLMVVTALVLIFILVFVLPNVRL